MNAVQLAKIFSYHKPPDNLIPIYNSIRDRAKEFALYINQMCPESREKSLAITSLQQTVMWANAAIAIYDKSDHPPPLERDIEKDPVKDW